MSRDTGDRDAELLTAYVDGVAELSSDERRGIEARLAREPGARADETAVRSLLDQLRALPPEGGEPDWAAMERSIHHAVGRNVPRPWWRRWTWIAPATTLATAMIVLLIVWGRPPASAPTSAPDHRVHPTHAPGGDDVVPLWLDGDEVDVDLSASEMLGDAVTSDDEPALPDGAGDPEPGLLPSADLAWVDHLDDDALARAERWLAGAGPDAAPGSPPSRTPADSPAEPATARKKG
jgi:hypothetical protein